MKVSEIGNTEKLFTLKEANQLLPLVRTITLSCQQQLMPVQQRLNKLLASDPRRNQLELDYEGIVQSWKTKIEQLGLYSRKLWQVEFDVGEGRLLWKLPDKNISVFIENRGQSSAGNMLHKQVNYLLKGYIKEFDPDWAKY